MYLWVDDERPTPVEGWDLAMDYDRAIAYLSKFQYHTVSLDHDLGQGKSGYQVVKWMIENDRLPGRIILHTANSVGRNNMRAALQAVGYKISNPVNIGTCKHCPTLIHSDV